MTTLTKYLNDLAGTTGLAEAGAANAAASTVGKATQGALNSLAGTSGLGIQGVLNLLAGTTGLGEVEAARRVAARNLLTTNQASVETSTAGFTPNGQTLTKSTVQAAHGLSSLLITTAGAGLTFPGTALAGGLGTSTAVTASATYTATISVRAPVVTYVSRVRLFWFKVDGSASAITAFSDGSDVALSNAWTTRTVTAAAPSDAAFAGVCLRFTAGAANELIYCDKFGLFAGSSTLWTP